jgi:murein L,D-transpeptidase YcbB/YkuD
MSASEVQSLPISTLKAVLFRNHVNAGMVVEKSELVSKVMGLIADERAEREAHARREEEEERARREAEEERDLQQALEQSRLEHEEREREMQREQATATPGASENHTAPAPAPSPSSESKAEVPRGKMSAKAQNMAAHLERTGLCVICQDEEANIAIVDCG